MQHGQNLGYTQKMKIPCNETKDKTLRQKKQK